MTFVSTTGQSRLRAAQKQVTVSKEYQYRAHQTEAVILSPPTCPPFVWRIYSAGFFFNHRHSPFNHRRSAFLWRIEVADSPLARSAVLSRTHQSRPSSISLWDTLGGLSSIIGHGSANPCPGRPNPTESTLTTPSPPSRSQTPGKPNSRSFADSGFGGWVMKRR